MSKKEKSLKSQNLPKITIYVIYCIAVYVVFTTGTSDFWESLIERFDVLNLSEGMVAIVAPIFSIILIGIFSADFKARLVYLRWNYALPGHRAFSHLAQSDPRIDISELEHKLGNLPINPKKQNSIWYKLLKKQEHITSVKDSHKVFLLTRDLTAISFIFSLVGTLAFMFQNQATGKIIGYLVFMLLHYILISISARHYGNRFVCNVLAAEVSNQQTDSIDKRLE